MVDYIRGKKTYTKWDTDTDNVDIEYLDGTVRSSGSKWFSGMKGITMKILILVLLFSGGLVLGYFIRRGVHEKQEVYSDVFPGGFFDSVQVKMLQQFIQPFSIQEFLRSLSERPHVAGTLSGEESASAIRSHWEALGLQDIRIEKYNVLLSYPSQNLPSTLTVEDDDNTVLLNISNANSRSELRPFLAYSPSGKVEGHLVYANYGRQEDFQLLQKLNVSIAGSVVIIKLGHGHRGDKVRWAAEYGAIGVLLYPDPADYVGKKEIFPDGLGLPENAIVYGSLKTFPGDPQTPGMPSIDSAYRVPIQSGAMDLPVIPALPLSYKDAENLLKLLGGQQAPENWSGNLNITYRLGPEFVKNNTIIKLDVNNDLIRKDIFNVIGVLHGQPETDEYVIIGSHHDTWTTGASDPASGMAVLMELVKAFTHLKETFWNPRRSIVFCVFDAEEFGIIGSTEYVEDHFKELVDNAIAYINIDSAITGNSMLHAIGSPLLLKTLHDAAKEVTIIGENETLFNQLSHSFDNGTNKPHGLGIIGTGSDFVSFMAGYGIPAIHVQYIDSDLDFDYPLYHTEFDTYDIIAKHVDQSFHASANLARLLATMVIFLTDSLVLPFNCGDYVNAMENGILELKHNYGDFLAQNGIYLDILERAVAHFSRAANLHISKFNKTNESRPFAIHEHNKQLMQVERTFVLPRGVRNSPIFRHAIFGPHPHDLHSGVVFPGIVDSILRLRDERMPSSINSSHPPQQNDVEAIKVQIAQVVNVIRAAGNMLIDSVVTHLTAYSFL